MMASHTRKDRNMNTEYSVEKQGTKWVVLDPTGVPIDGFKTKRAAEERAAELTNTPRVVKSGSKWAAVANGEAVSTHATKKAAEAALADLGRENVAAYLDKAEFVAVDYATMDRTERLLAAKAEKVAVKAWKAAGEDGERPATPINDWLADPASAEVRKNGRRNGHSGPRVRRTDLEAQAAADLVDLIVAKRGEGWSFPKITKLVNGQEVDGEQRTAILTADGVPWTQPQLFHWARRRQVPVFGKTKAEVGS